MWCLVSQPNATKNADLVIEVRLSHKATGQECLSQVKQNHLSKMSNFEIYIIIYIFKTVIRSAKNLE